MKYLPPVRPAQIGPEIENAQNLLKSGLTDIRNMPILILISETIFMKYLVAPVRTKLIPKLKMPSIY